MLEGLYARDGPSTALVYGRRRIGKTFLLERFCEGKRHLFIRPVLASERINLEYLSEAVSEHVGSEMGPYANYRKFLSDLGEICRDEKTVVVIDEFPYLTGGCPELSSYLQHFIDGTLRRTESMLILCGSSISAMRSEFADSGTPLFGRFDRTIELTQMPLGECRLFHPNMSEIDCLRLYMTVGGVPKYHAEIRQDTYEDALMENYLGGGWMADEAGFLLASEFGNPRRHADVVSAVSGGAVRLKEISERVGMDPSNCQRVIHDLLGIGILGTVNPMMDAPKRPTYFIKDHMFAFDQDILKRRRTLVSSMDGGGAVRALDHHLRTYFGHRFELVCMDHLSRSRNVLEIGKWWRGGADGHAEIDIVATVLEDGLKYDVFGECKFRETPVGFAELDELDMKTQRFSKNANVRLMLFSASGFKDHLRGIADDAGVKLVGLDELFGRKAPDGLR